VKKPVSKFFFRMQPAARYSWVVAGWSAHDVADMAGRAYKLPPELFEKNVWAGKVGGTFHHVIVVRQNTFNSVDDSRYGPHVTNLTPGSGNPMSPRYFAFKTPVDDTQCCPCNQSDTRK
jgi:hypothetical protein